MKTSPYSLKPPQCKRGLDSALIPSSRHSASEGWARYQYTKRYKVLQVNNSGENESLFPQAAPVQARVGLGITG